MSVTRPNIEFQYVIDYSKGRTSYGKRLWGYATHAKRKTVVVIDLERNWKAARFAARKQHRNTFRMFVAEMLETFDHEMVHAFERGEFPHRWIAIGERGAESFSAAGQWARSKRE